MTARASARRAGRTPSRCQVERAARLPRRSERAQTRHGSAARRNGGGLRARQRLFGSSMAIPSLILTRSTSCHSRRWPWIDAKAFQKMNSRSPRRTGAVTHGRVVRLRAAWVQGSIARRNRRQSGRDERVALTPLPVQAGSVRGGLQARTRPTGWTVRRRLPRSRRRYLGSASRGLPCLSQCNRRVLGAANNDRRCSLVLGLKRYVRLKIGS